MKKALVLLLCAVCVMQVACAKEPSQDALQETDGTNPPRYEATQSFDDLITEYPDETVQPEDQIPEYPEETVQIDEEQWPDYNDGDSDETDTEPVSQPENSVPATAPTVQTDPEDKVQTDVAEPLTWAKINAIPVANSSMSTDQLRKICTDFMRLQLSFPWTPSQSLTFASANKQATVNEGAVYGGLPYVSSTFGNLYNAMEYYDETTGILKLDKEILKIIGNQCSASAYWAWSRVSNAISFGGTQTTLQKNGCLRVGNYTYSDSINSFHTEKIATATICKQNGEQVMYESYALLLPADGLNMYTGTAGHVRMVAEKANVVRNADGTINPERSSVTFLDQGNTWSSGTQSNGKPIKIQGGVDVTVSFRSLYQSGYLPFRIPELAGKSAVEKATATSNLTAGSVKVSVLRNSSISANYPISDITVTVKNSTDKAVYRYTYAVCDLNVYQSSLTNAVKSGGLSPYTDGTYTVEISARVGTGEKLIAYSGKLTN